MTTAPDHAAICSLSAVGHAEHLGDDIERQREGQLGDDVAATRSAIASSISSTSSCTRGRSASIDDGVKALLTSRRSRVWSGGSTSSMLVERSISPPDASRKSAWRCSSKISTFSSLTLIDGSLQQPRHVVVREQQPLVHHREVDRVVLTHLREVG